MTDFNQSSTYLDRGGVYYNADNVTVRQSALVIAVTARFPLLIHLSFGKKKKKQHRRRPKSRLAQ